MSVKIWRSNGVKRLHRFTKYLRKRGIFPMSSDDRCSHERDGGRGQESGGANLHVGSGQLEPILAVDGANVICTVAVPGELVEEVGHLQRWHCSVCARLSLSRDSCLVGRSGSAGGRNRRPGRARRSALTTAVRRSLLNTAIDARVGVGARRKQQGAPVGCVALLERDCDGIDKTKGGG